MQVLFSRLRAFSISRSVCSLEAGPDSMEEDEEEPAVRLGNTEREASQSAEDSAAGGLAPSHSGQYDSTGPSTEGQQDHPKQLCLEDVIALHHCMASLRCLPRIALLLSRHNITCLLFVAHHAITGLCLYPLRYRSGHRFLHNVSHAAASCLP